MKNDKLLAVICYIPPLFAILILLKRKCPLVFLHAKQAFAPWFIFCLAWALSLLPGGFFAVAKWPLCLTMAAYSAYLLIYGISLAARGEAKLLPVIGQPLDSFPLFQKLQGS